MMNNISIKNTYKKIIVEGFNNLSIRKYQKRFLLDNKNRRRIVLKSRQTGFSYLCALEAVVEALLTCKNQLLAAASDRQSKIMISYAKFFLTKIFNITPVRMSDEKIELPNGAELIALPKNWNTIQGFNGSIYFDEFAWNVDDVKIWRALVPSTSAVEGRITVLSTPYAKRGKFYDLWTNNLNYSHHKVDIYQALKEGMPLGRFSSTEELIQSYKDDLDDPDFFPSAYECKFIDNLDSYIPLSLIEPLQKLNINEKYGQQLWLGIDIGRKKDATEITAVGKNKKGKKEVRFITTLKKTSFNKQKQVIKKIFRDNEVYKCFIDRTGIGLNLYEDLRAIFHNKVIGVHFNMKNKEYMAKNVKNHLEEKELFLLKERDAARQYASIKRISTESGFKYNCEKNKDNHADKFWSLALALEAFRRNKRKITSRWHRR